MNNKKFQILQMQVLLYGHAMYIHNSQMSIHSFHTVSPKWSIAWKNDKYKTCFSTRENPRQITDFSVPRIRHRGV
jgi:hypothetical protein